MAQLDFCDKLSLNFVYSEAYHKVRHNLRFLGGFSYNSYSLVYIEQDKLQALQKVKLVLLFVQIKINPAAHALYTERSPLLQKLANTQNPRSAADKHIEVTAEAVLQSCHLIELLHKLVGICAAFQIDCNLKSVKTRFVTDI